MSHETGMPAATATSAAARERAQDALYQNGRVVARVLDPEVDASAKEIRFREVYSSDELLLPEECEYQEYRILIQRVAYASRVDKEEPHKGRILRGVVAELLGYRAQ